MKKTLYNIVIGTVGLLMCSCGDFTDIQPKGENLLSSTDDLELLLNTDNYSNIFSRNNWRVGSNTLYAYDDVTVPLNAEKKTAVALMNGYFDDEQSLNRWAELTNSDGYYTACYNIIGRVSNPILNQLAMAEGTEAKKNALKAEALVARSFAHFMALQRYAAAYNGSNGDTPAIIYMTEDKDITLLWEKNTIQECYDLCLKDIDDALALNALPAKAINYMRWDKTSATAVKSLILLGMRKYSEAEAAAKEVLAANSYLWDWWANAKDGMSMFGVPYKSAAIDDRNNEETIFCIPDLTYYGWVCPEEWNAMEENYGKRGLAELMSKAYAGYPAYADYGAMLGLSGWQAGTDFNNYANVGGLNTPMMYLIVAECELRAGNIGTAMNWLDKLRAKRLPEGYDKWEGTITAKGDAIEALKKTMAAEFLWRDWTFFWRKRWNTETEWQTTLSHTIGGKTYTLSPSSKMWIFPFPVNATQMNPNLTQNW